MLGSFPDLLRLLVVPVFAWAAYRDVQTRRLPNALWYPLVALGAVLLVWDVAARWPLSSVGDRLFLIRVAFSLGFVVPLSYVFWWLGGFGGADAKALMALAVVFPTFPTYTLGTLRLPVVEPLLGVFSMTILTNTVIVALAYPVVLLVRNLLARDIPSFLPAVFLGYQTTVDALRTEHGRLLETRDGFTRSGVDLDALRMYLRWRGSTLADLRTRPDDHRDPASVGQTFDPTDGAVHDGPMTDGGVVTERTGADTAEDDPWAAERFLDDIDGTAYGTSPESLRDGLELVVEREHVWISPGLPFVVPMFAGLLVALTVGDLLFGFLSLVGL